MVFKESKKAAQGIGTLIIFIAMILVSAVAAAVLIQTASSLQSKSLDVGRQSQEKITTDIDIVQVYAADTSDSILNGNADNITIVVRLGSGSTSIKLADLLLKYDTSAGSQTLTVGPIATGTYGVSYIINGTNHKQNYLVSGDLAKFTFTVGAGVNITESESTTLRLIAKNGAVKPIDITTPAAMTRETTYLYP